ncbi:hypothetical protein BT93_I0238 [Corymbia citriodora subsp. variegata]|nr:hypothetical protein BT93_I0238 [Corymbia citriodora subsp. variegata]
MLRNISILFCRLWLDIIRGLVIYRLLRSFFSSTDDLLDFDFSASNALFSVASRLEKLYHGKAYVGLRIPDPDTGSRQHIDLAFVTKGKVSVVSVKNFADFISICKDGSWACRDESGYKKQSHPDPVAEAKKAASILESYLKRRGVALPVGNLPHLVVLPNPKFCSLNFLLSEYRPPPEVITYLKWAQLKPESKGMLSRWLKGAFCGAKKETQEPMHQQLSFVLGTAPMWDRLELNGDKYVLGEFLEFKGKEEDIQVLRNIRRSKIDRLIIQKTSIFGLGCYLSYESAAPLRLQVSYSPRDYRSEGASSSEWKELTVRSSTEILFQPADSRKVRKVKLSTVVSMTLSA